MNEFNIDISERDDEDNKEIKDFLNVQYALKI